LFDEYQKLFLYGQAEKNFNSLLDFKILPILFPRLPQILKDKMNAQMILLALRNTDERYYAKKTINPAFLISIFLWPALFEVKQALLKTMTPREANKEAVATVLKMQTQATSMPRYQAEVIEDIWYLQRQLEQRRSKKVLSILEHPRYRAAYDFLLLRSEIGQTKSSLCEWWHRLYLMSPEDRSAFVATLK
jgi:poly(A) polymerase